MTEFQYGFGKSRSTSQAITQLLNHVNHSLNNSTPTVALFINFKKAFDCLRYPTLLEKLKTFKLGDVVVSWVKNYLANRMQTTVVNRLSSPPLKVEQGVPQGSILGPLLYILYANDISFTIKVTKFAFYADDTVFYSSSKDVEKAIARIQRHLDRLLTWCSENGIYINPAKTKYMIFSSRELKGPHKQLTVHGTPLEQFQTFNYLGVVLDQHLTFNNHAKHVIQRVSSKVYQLRMLKKFL